MLKKIIRRFKKNPLDEILKKAKEQKSKTFLLPWNRALGDISLGLYYVVNKIKKEIPDSKITFLIREDLKAGFELLGGINYITVSFWRRYVPIDIYHAMKLLNIKESSYDVILKEVDPNYWIKDQIGKITPKLKWNNDFDQLIDKFNLPNDKILIAVAPQIETKHSFWRSWDKKNFQSLFSQYKDQKDVLFVLFGEKNIDIYIGDNIIDLRGKTTLLEALSIIKNACNYFICLDSGLLSLLFFLDVNFPIKIISLWADLGVGILKHKVTSPNQKLVDVRLIYENGLENLKPKEVKKHLYPFDIENFLEKPSQKKLFLKFLKFSIQEKKIFIKEIFSLDIKGIEDQRKAFFLKKQNLENYYPLEQSSFATKEDFEEGKRIIKSKKAACIIMAAGSGSRLNSTLPKGLFKVDNKTLFEHFFIKILNKQKKYNTKLYISIMTSQDNHDLIREFFEKNNFFNLEIDQVDFFMQDDMPFLTKEGNWLLDNFKIAKGPNGNGELFKNFYSSNLFEKYHDKNIEHLSIVPIDNILLDPFDEKLLGFHKNSQNEVTIKCIKREEFQEKKGAYALDTKGNIKIIEYINLDLNKNYKFSNTGIYLVDLNFIKKVKDIVLPIYFVYKKINSSSNVYAYKAESFIFDNVNFAKKNSTLLDFKENFYAPLKDINSLKNIEKILKLEKESRFMVK